jgi:hypothetical protein
MSVKINMLYTDTFLRVENETDRNVSYQLFIYVYEIIVKDEA